MEKIRGFERVTRTNGEEQDFLLPKRMTKHSAGYDFFSPEDVEIKPNEKYLIKTGIKSYFQEDEGLFIYPRSSFGFKHGIMLANTIGVIESDYYNNESNEGEICVKLFNTSDKVFNITKGDRFCQAVFKKFLITDDDNAESVRTGGMGSTGTK